MTHVQKIVLACTALVISNFAGTVIGIYFGSHSEQVQSPSIQNNLVSIKPIDLTSSGVDSAFLAAKINEITVALNTLKDKTQKLEQSIQLNQSNVEKPDASSIKAKSTFSKPNLLDRSNLSQVKEFIDHTLSSLENTDQLSGQQEQIEWLKELGPENISILIESMKGKDWKGKFIISKALIGLVRNEDQNQILSSLKEVPELSEVIYDKGWSNEARDILVAGLKQDHLPIDWIRSVALLKDPNTYDDLKDAMIRSSSRAYIYETIQNMIPIDTATVTEAWTKAKLSGNEFERGSFATVAAQYGYKDALDVLVDSLKNDANSPGSIYNAKEKILQLTDARGSPEDIQKWYSENRANLQWDQNRKHFESR